MGKIGRNAICPCGSGLKFKKCCLNRQREGAGQPTPSPAHPSLTSEIKDLQQVAVSRQEFLKVLGVFILLATEAGDAWVLELTEMDAVQVAAAGEVLEVEIEENPQTLEINWSHRFQFKNKKLILTSYADQSETTPDGWPVQQIKETVKEIGKRLSPELLKSIHLQAEAAA